MNKNKLFHAYCIIIVCIIGLLGACTQEESTQSICDTDQLPLNIIPTVGDAFTRTTATNGNYRFSDQDAIGLFAVKSGNLPSASDKVYNQKYVYNGTSWNVQSDNVYWPVGELGTACVLYGYYPYEERVSNLQKHTFSINWDQSTVEKMYANDFLYTKKPVNKANEAVILSMSHLFSMVTINIKREDVGAIESDINLLAKPTVTINLLNGETIINNGTKLFITPAVLENAPEGYSASYSAIIPPQKIDNSSPFLSLFVGNILKNININRDFESGKHYSINLTITKDKNIVLQGVYVSQWDEQVTITNGSKSEIAIYNTGDVIEYQKKRDNHPVTFIVTGDGFIKEHMLKGGMFEQYATEAIEFLFDTEPFKSYRDYFNVYFIPAVSNTSQISNTGSNNTYFGTYWDTSINRMENLNSSRLFNFVQTYCPDIKEGKTAIEKVITIVLVNYPEHDGIAWMYESGKCYAMSTLPSGSYEMGGPNADKAGIYVGDWRNIVLHEAGGHAFGRLADEYWYENSTRVVVTGGSELASRQRWTVPACKNVADDISENSTTCYWHHLTGDSRFPKVGYFEGAYVSPTGYWRCEEASCMIDNRQYFNAYSRQLIVERIMNISNETFTFEDFVAKDVDYDEVLDNKNKGANSRILKGSFNDSELKKCRPLSPPVLVDGE